MGHTIVQAVCVTDRLTDCVNDRLNHRLATLLSSPAMQSLGPADALKVLIANRLDQLPMPGAGATLARWQALAAVAEFDVSLAKLYEGHTDALAILSELQGPESTDAASPGAWCVWAAESAGAKVTVVPINGPNVSLSGSKNWCSGAATADHALLTAWEPGGDLPQLVRIALHDNGMAVDRSAWKAVGMARSDSLGVSFDAAAGPCAGVRVGKAGAYLQRPGFWQGGAGVAACWWGGALSIAKALSQSMKSAPTRVSQFQWAALGRVELALHETAAVLRESARWIDDHPASDASRVALTARLSAERCAKQVLDTVGHAMGATPYCRDEKFAQAAADLPVFIRQLHGEHDFAALGERAAAADGAAWTL